MAPGGPPGRGGIANRARQRKKFTRGGGKHFSRDLRPLDSDGNEIRIKNPEDSSSEEESEEEEESSEDEQPQQMMTREERRAAAKAKKEAAIAKKKGVPQPGDMPSSDDSDSDLGDMPGNPNHTKAARSQASAAPLSVDEAAERVSELSVGDGRKKGGAKQSVSQLSRREREALQAQQAKERYQKLHEAGKTDEAKADLARLALIREKRAQEAARKQAETEELEEQARIKKAEIEAREAKRREAALGPSGKGKGKAKK